MRQISLMLERMITHFYKDETVPIEIRKALVSAFVKARVQVETIEQTQGNIENSGLPNADILSQMVPSMPDGWVPSELDKKGD